MKTYLCSQLSVTLLSNRCGINNFLFISDPHFKWIQSYHMTQGTTAAETIHWLHNYCAWWNIMRSLLIMVDGPPFNFPKGNVFCLQIRINHKWFPPYWLQANGAADNTVGTFKDKVSKAKDAGTELQEATLRFLLDYKTAEPAATKKLTKSGNPDPLDILLPNTPILTVSWTFYSMKKNPNFKLIIKSTRETFDLAIQNGPPA